MMGVLRVSMTSAAATNMGVIPVDGVRKLSKSGNELQEELGTTDEYRERVTGRGRFAGTGSRR